MGKSFFLWSSRNVELIGLEMNYWACLWWLCTMQWIATNESIQETPRRENNCTSFCESTTSPSWSTALQIQSPDILRCSKAFASPGNLSAKYQSNLNEAWIKILYFSKPQTAVKCRKKAKSVANPQACDKKKYCNMCNIDNHLWFGHGH